MTTWQPIATAPKDRALLGYWGDSKWPRGGWSYGVMVWIGDSWCEVETTDEYLTAPTHWMPLPPAPPVTP